MSKKRSILHAFFLLVIIAILLSIASSLVLQRWVPSISLTNKIGVIPIEGVISSSFDITSQIEKFREDDSIKAIILRINSPGGSVAPTQEIYREIRKTIREKKVVASIGGVGASGGYYIAAAANKIVASPATVTGSIGVIMNYMQIKGLLKKLGIKLGSLKSGEFKDLGAPYRDMTDKEKRLVTDILMEIKEQFVKAVAEGRHLPIKEVEKIADGRIILGSQAKRLGLVDKMGNFQDAVELAKELANIEGKVKLVYPRYHSASLIARLLDNAVQRLIFRASFPMIEYRLVNPIR